MLVHMYAILNTKIIDDRYVYIYQLKFIFVNYICSGITLQHDFTGASELPE